MVTDADKVMICGIIADWKASGMTHEAIENEITKLERYGNADDASELADYMRSVN